MRGMRILICDMISSCHLLDAGFQGSPFTWRHGRLYQRLDKVLINIQWRMKFQSTSIFRLPFFKFDHKAILVQMKRKRKQKKRHRHFRFLAAWLAHMDFPNLMTEAWLRNANWCSQIILLQGSLNNWN